MFKKKPVSVIKQGHKHSSRISVGLLAAAMSPGLMAAENQVELEEIEVRSGQLIRSGYRAPNTEIGKRAQDIQDIPQSITIINQQLIKDQAAGDLKSTLRNAGITFQAGEGGQAEVPIIRGISAGGDVYSDGLRGPSVEFNGDTYNTERVEVLKGSAAALFGRGAAGGVINQVSKLPYLGSGGDVSVGVGTRGYKRITADVNHAFNDDIAVRLNAMGEDRDSHRKPVNNKKWGVAPSISFGLSGDTQLHLSYRHDNENNISDFGIPYLNDGPGRRVAAVSAASQFFGYNHDFEDIKRDNFTAKLEHKFNDNMKLSNTTRFSRTRYDTLVTVPRFVGGTTANTIDGEIRRDISPTANGQTDGRATHYDAKAWTNQTDFNFKFDTGGLKHDVLVNAELTREERKNFNHRYSFFNPDGTPAQTVNPIGLNHGRPTENFRWTRTTADGDVLTTNTIGVGVSDIVEITPQIKAIVGARFNHIKTENAPPGSGSRTSRSDNVWTYNGSVIWEPVEGHNVYLTYGTAVTPVAYRSNGFESTLDPQQLVREPEKTRTIELGSKNTFFNDAIAVNTALFHTKKTQQYYRDTGFIDSLVVYGLDMEVSGRITDRLNILGNLVWANGKMKATEAATIQLDGQFPEAAARFTANIWGNYRITDAINAGLGVRYVGDRYTQQVRRGTIPAQVQRLPAYTVADAMLSYENKNYRAQLNVNNIFDKKHVTSGHRQQALAGERRTAIMTLGYKF